VTTIHPGDVMFRDLPPDQQKEIARGWHHRLADAADLFDGLTDDRRRDVLSTLDGRDGG
jgi:hypothetical protein